MLKFSNISGSTYCLNGITNIGIYVNNEGFCTLIDTGIDKLCFNTLIKICSDNKWTVKSIINTHGHSDHFGGNRIIKQKTGAEVYASSFESSFIENPELQTLYLFTASAEKNLRIKFFCAEACNVDHIVEPGKNVINGSNFDIISLKGHSRNQIGVVTEDRVCFLGDAVCSGKTLDEYGIPYFDNIESSVKSLEMLKKSNYEYYVLGHNEIVHDICELAERNLNAVNELVNIIKDYLYVPKKREDIVEFIIKRYKIPLTAAQYYIVFASVSAYLTYLSDKGIIKSIIKNNGLLWVRAD